MVELNKISDSRLISKIKNESCNDSFRELVSRHENLYYKICHGYVNALKKVGVSTEDILADKLFVFFTSVSSFKSDKKVKFSTWLASQVENLTFLSLLKEETEVKNTNNLSARISSIETPTFFNALT